MFRTSQDTIENTKVEPVGTNSNNVSPLKINFKDSLNLKDKLKTIVQPKKEHKGKKSKVKSTTDAEGVETTTKTLSEDELLKLHPIISIARLPTRKFNIRLVIWNGENVPAMDLGGSSDVYVKAWLTTQ